MKRLTTIILLFMVSLINAACTPTVPVATATAVVALPVTPSLTPQMTPTVVAVPFVAQSPTPQITPTTTPTATPTVPAIGCANVDYPDWETSPYVLPFPVGETYQVRLGNCSSSYHAAGRPDALAYDFVMKRGTLITAARAGRVIYVEESGKGREINNLVIVNHGDGTFGQYMHLKQDGALVEVGDLVEQGDEIGLSGATGLAGYPHLHFVVTQGGWDWPYEGVPVTFSNTTPNPTGLASNTEFTAFPYP